MSGIFRGNFALVVKIVILAGVTAILSLLAQSAFARGEIAIGSFLVISIVALNFTYLTKVSIPLKFFVPGVLLFIAFVIGPIIFTVVMSTFNYKTGNYISKEAAIEQVLIRGVEPDANQTTFDVVAGKISDGKDAILVSDVANQKFFLSTQDNLSTLDANEVVVNEYGVATTAPNFVATSLEDLALDDSYAKI